MLYQNIYTYGYTRINFEKQYVPELKEAAFVSVLEKYEKPIYQSAQLHGYGI